jgi:hypothetical protein
MSLQSYPSVFCSGIRASNLARSRAAYFVDRRLNLLSPVPACAPPALRDPRNLAPLGVSSLAFVVHPNWTLILKKRSWFSCFQRGKPGKKPKTCIVPLRRDG